MDQREPEWNDVHDALERVRRELEAAEPIRARVERRLGATRIRSARFTIPRLSAVAAVLVVGWMVVRNHRAAPPQAPPFTIEQICDSSAAYGDMEITEHVAAILDQQTVLVIWSARDNGNQPTKTGVTRIGKYRRRMLRQTRTADGRLVACELFVADEGVQAALQPPAIVARSASSLIALDASPRVLSNEQLNRLLASPDVGLRMEDLTLGNDTP